MKRLTTILFALVILLLAGCQDNEPPTATAILPLPTSTAVPATTVPVEPTVQVNETAVPTATDEPTATPEPLEFDGQSSYDFLLAQMEFGPRWPGSEGHTAVREYIVQQLVMMDWQVEVQSFPYQDVTGYNLIGKANIGQGPVIILGAHYDTRKTADQTEGSTDPVPGAVDGASGVAVLLELARTLDLADIDHEIWLAFFDIEDNGNDGIPGFDWIIGSRYMAENLTITPQAMVLVDMIGDSDQQLYYEGNSDPVLQAELWQIAADLGYEAYFIPEMKYTMIDDHLPFAERGIPAVDIIDFDYEYWHTVEDTADKASPESLFRVGQTLEVWLETHLGN